MGELNVVAVESPLAAALRGPERKRIGFRPESARLGGDGIVATVRHATYLGSKTELVVAVATGEELKLWTTAPVAAGEAVRFSVPPEKLIAL